MDEPPRAKAPGWGINGRACRPNGRRVVRASGILRQPAPMKRAGGFIRTLKYRAGKYKLWVRYADWANLTENL